MKNVLIVLPTTDGDKQNYKKAGPMCEFTFCGVKDVTESMVREMHVIIGNVNPALIQFADNLEWLQLNSAGFEKYVVPGVLDDQVILTNATGAYGPAVGEHLTALVFAVSKKLHLYRDSQRACDWTDHGQVLPLHGQNVLIIGLGDIGLHFAKIMYNMGNRIMGIRRKMDNKPDYVDELIELDNLQQVLPKADIVAMCIPLSEQTRGLMGKEQFAAMKDTALFFNVGRGELVVTEALQEALENGEILGAGIDVTDPEPLPRDNPLWKAPNIFITPHSSGGFHLPETLRNIQKIALENFKRYMNQENLINVIQRR